MMANVGELPTEIGRYCVREQIGVQEHGQSS